ncbi:MAG: hypothetical protein IIA12_05490, partial [Proteobacteria bacterium]|nr:hypothetical protein [Pseudomonadota bacterium]
MEIQNVAQETRKRLNNDVLRFIRSNAAESLSVSEILTWGIKNFKTRISLSCSFGSPEGLVLLDMMNGIDPTSRGTSVSAIVNHIDRAKNKGLNPKQFKDSAGDFDVPALRAARRV